MSSQALPPRTVELAGRRFAVRFLGRRGAWLWLLGTGVLAAAAWFAVALPARGSAAAERTWFLWSGNVLLALFVAAMAFVVRKWSIKLPWFRDFGRAPAENADACWAAVQELNQKIRKGAFAQDAEIAAAAQDILDRFGVSGIQRADLTVFAAGGRTVKLVQLRKKEPFGRLEPWLEMHMGLGTTACLAVLLHADFALRHPVGWALFAGSMIVLVTGLAGAVLYRLLPERIARSDFQIPYEEAGVARLNYQACIEGVLATLDERLRAELAPLAAPAANAQQARERAASVLAKVAAYQTSSLELARDLVVMAGSRDELLRNTAGLRRADLLLKLWRWVHVPVTVALCFVIALHVWAVVWY